MASAVVFCDNCGAMNPAGAPYCEQCQAALYAGSPPDAAPLNGDDDGFRILTGSPPTTPLPTARARWRPGRGTPAPTGTLDLDSIPVAPRRAPVGTDQEPPPIQLPAGMPAGLPAVELPKAPKIEPPKVEPPKGVAALFKPPPAPTGRKESGAPAPAPKIPKWMIALVAVLALLLVGIVGAAGLKAGPFDDKPVTATAEAQQTAVAAIFVTQTHTVELAQSTAEALATSGARATGTAITEAAATALAVEHAATQSAVQTALADKDAIATAETAKHHATETALSNALAARETQVGVAQTAIAAAQATAHTLDVLRSTQATMNALLTAVAPPPPPAKPQGLLVAPPPLAARPSVAPVPALRLARGAGPGAACPAAGGRLAGGRLAGGSGPPLAMGADTRGAAPRFPGPVALAEWSSRWARRPSIQ